MTLWAQTNAMSYDQVGSFSDRAVNAAVSLGEYFKSWVWPEGLTVFYPYSSNLHHPTLVMVSLAFLFLFTLFATAVRKRLPFVLVGWLWFLGMMVPVLGLVQVGVQARADRYTYLPQIGLAVAVVWLAQRTRLPRVMVWTCFALVISGFAWKTRQQVEFWRDDETLWRHTLQHTESNHVAHMNLGVALAAQKRIPEAVSELKKALEIKPSDGKSNYNLGLLLQQSGQNEEALGHFRIAANNSLAPEAHYELGFTLFELRQFDESIVELQKAIQINPNQPESHYTLAQSLLNKGEGRRAIQQMQEGLRYSPNDLTLTCYLSYLLSTHPEKEYRDGNQALGLAQKALAFKSPNSTWTLAVLGAAQAENGDFSHATESAEKALTEAEKLGNPALLQVIQNQLSLYRQNRPFRDPSLGGAISEAIAP
jgi:tetratricopeptide (TPR) repeat protein